MDPIVARGFVELGFDTQEKLAQWRRIDARRASGAA
jgi:hypothetical protein